MGGDEGAVEGGDVAIVRENDWKTRQSRVWQVVPGSSSRCVAVCCSVLQCVASCAGFLFKVCCSVLQCVAVCGKLCRVPL